MKKYFILFVLSILIFPSMVLGDSIESIKMDIYVDNSGTAHVTEVWDANINNGTEGYKPYYNLGESDISNYKVSMDNRDFAYVNSWNVNGDFSSKAYKNGLNYISDGVELCFGISKYGRNTYTLSYDISNFVINTSDGYQVIYWTLFPYNYKQSPGRVYVKIHSDFRYDDSLPVWGYGKYGMPAYVYDGYIEIDSETTVHSDEYVTVLVKFNGNTFNTTYSTNKSFDDFLSMSQKGAVKYEDKMSFSEIISMIFSFGMPIAIFIICIVAAKGKEYGYINNKKINKKETMLFRDIPCDKNIYLASTLTKLNKNVFNGYKETNIFGAIILKWVRDGKVLFIREEKTGLFKSNNSKIDLTLNPTFDNPLEKELFDYMYKASKDGILETDELKKWCNNNYTKFFDLFKRIDKVEMEKLKANNHIYKRNNKAECKKKNVMDNYIYDESSKLYGLKKFLDEFSNMNSREVLEVKLWDEYLMFAYIFGNAEKVANQLKNLYPDLLENENIDYNTIILIDHFTSSGVNSASSARSRAESYSSGGGGFSSGGGGGGSFGGGGGGGGGFR